MRSFSLTLLLLITSFASLRAEDKPNVLFITVDDLNCDLSCYGHSLVKSPNIDRLANRGVRFDKAYCQYPVCNPSRSSFLTGLYPDQTGVLSNGDSFRKTVPDVVTLPQHFKQNGYYVARVGKIFHYGVPTQIGTPGDDDPISWQHVVNPSGIDKRVELEGKIHSLKPGSYGGTLSWLKVESEDSEHTDGIGTAAMVDLLKQHHPEKTGKPFFLAMGFYRPHTPYVAPSPYFAKYPLEAIDPVLEKPGDRDDIPLAALHDRPKQRELTVPERKEIIQAYYASISLMDTLVGQLLDSLTRLKLDSNTIIVFVSDHGYHLGAHGLWQKGDLFEGSCRVPMIISRPGMKAAGKTAAHVAEMIDLYPTLTELAGLSTPKHVMGVSLVPVLKNPLQSVRDAAFTVTVSRGPEFRQKYKVKAKGYTLRTDRYRYTEWGEYGKYGRELYDYENDPEEFTNLSDSQKHESIVTQLSQQLHKRQSEQK
ncbi:sulfatase [Planctomycetaceae bacterium]|jgi:iduronate 2-sulfatase|nr:sulfatase [Planctomycetaceae bacterium]